MFASSWKRMTIVIVIGVAKVRVLFKKTEKERGKIKTESEREREQTRTDNIKSERIYKITILDIYIQMEATLNAIHNVWMWALALCTQVQ